MSWAEFKSMPDDIQISYVKMIRKRYGVSDSKIAKMLGVGQKRFSEKMQELGIGLGRHAGHAGADKEGFLAWCNTIPLPISSDEEILEEVAEASEEVMEANTEDVCEHIPVINELSICAIPSSGSLTFTGSAEAALKTVSVLLGGGKCHYKYFVGSTVGTQKGCGYLWLM